MNKKYAFSLNMSNESESRLAQRLDSADNASAIIKSVLLAEEKRPVEQAEPVEPEVPQCTLNDIMAMLYDLQSQIQGHTEGLDAVYQAVDNIHARISEIGTQPATVYTSEAPPPVYTDEETPEQAEDRLIAEGMSPAALVALKTSVFKPGMRMND